MARNDIFPSFYTLLLSLECLLLSARFLMVDGYNASVIQSSIECNRTTLTFNLDPGSYIVKQLFYNCVPVSPIVCGGFGKIYVQNYFSNGSEVFSEDDQNNAVYPISVDFNQYNLTPQPIGGDGYEVAEMIQVPLVAVPYAPNRTADFLPGGRLQLWNSSFPFFVNCLWKSEFRDNSSLGVGPGINGGGQTGTVSGNRAVNMTIGPRDGGGNGTVEQGSAVRVTINLTDTEYFAAELPRQCTIGILSSQLFSPISDSCPNVGLEAASIALGVHSMKVNNQSYYFDFNAFTVDGAATQLTISCWIQVCVNPAACQNACWDASHTLPTRNFGRLTEKIDSKIEGIIASKQVTITALPRDPDRNIGVKTSISFWLLSMCIINIIRHCFRT